MPLIPATPSRKRGGRHSKDKLPMQNLPIVDELRMRLREIGGKVQGGALAELPTVPGVESLSIATRYIPGGRVRFMEFVQYAALNDQNASKKFWMVLADLTPNQRAIVSFDDVAAAAGVRPSQLLMEVVGCATEFGHDVGNLVAAALQPALVHRTGRSAMRIAGEHAKIAQRDREMLFEHSNFIPTTGRAASSVVVNNNASANAQAASVVASDPSVPSFSSTMRDLQQVREQTQAQLSAPAATTINVTPGRVSVNVPGQ